MGLREFLLGLLFCALVVIVALTAFWLVSEGSKRAALPPIVQRIAVCVIVLAGVVALVWHFAGGYIPP